MSLQLFLTGKIRLIQEDAVILTGEIRNAKTKEIK